MAKSSFGIFLAADSAWTVDNNTAKMRNPLLGLLLVEEPWLVSKSVM